MEHPAIIFRTTFTSKFTTQMRKPSGYKYTVVNKQAARVAANQALQPRLVSNTISELYTNCDGHNVALLKSDNKGSWLHFKSSWFPAYSVFAQTIQSPTILVRSTRSRLHSPHQVLCNTHAPAQAADLATTGRQTFLRTRTHAQPICRLSCLE
jgi:hypothetical protein